MIHYEKKNTAITYKNIKIYCIINSVACYMFRPPTAATFMEVFFLRICHIELAYIIPYHHHHLANTVLDRVDPFLSHKSL